MLTSFSKSVLEQGVKDGAIGAGDLEAIHLLAEQGIHPEQVLVGGGMVARNRYAEWLSKASGWPVADVLPDTTTELKGLDESLIERGVLPILVTKKAAEVAFTDPEAGLVEQVRQMALKSSKEFRPAVMLIAEFRKRVPWKDKLMHPVRTLKQLFKEADRRGSHQIRLLPSDDSWHAFFDSGDGDAVSLPMRYASSMRMRMQRFGSKSGWHVQASRSGSEPVLFLVRRKGSGRHPLEWSSLLASNQDGLTVVISPDAFAARQLAGKMEEGIKAFDADQEDDREMAVHEALAGHPAYAFASQDGDWYVPVLQAGIPLHIVRGHRSPDGIAWETVV